MDRRTSLAVAGALSLTVLAGGAVALVTRDRPHVTSLTPLNGAPYAAPGASVPASTEPGADEPTPEPPGTYVLTTPSPDTRPPLRATPDPPKPAHYPLPIGCLSYAHSCAYPGATGAVTGGPLTVDTAVAGPTSVRMSWTSRNMYSD
ncbi:MAG: hypothetical protein QOE45_1815, partial [Frankiaceae bacterium]|nr:hypothetical protein [Frankiaceae bacterium]